MKLQVADKKDVVELHENDGIDVEVADEDGIDQESAEEEIARMEARILELRASLRSKTSIKPSSPSFREARPPTVNIERSVARAGPSRPRRRPRDERFGHGGGFVSPNAFGIQRWSPNRTWGNSLTGNHFPDFIQASNPSLGGTIFRGPGDFVPGSVESEEGYRIVENSPCETRGLGSADLSTGGHGSRQGNRQYSPVPGPFNDLPVGRPAARDMKMHLLPFDGKETYPGLGSGFQEWGMGFIRELNMVQLSSGLMWPEDVKVIHVGNHLKDHTLNYYQRNVEM